MVDKQAFDQACVLYDRLMADDRPQVSPLAQTYCLQRMIEEAHRIFGQARTRGAERLLTDPEVSRLFLNVLNQLGAAQALVDGIVRCREELARPPLSGA